MGTDRQGSMEKGSQEGTQDSKKTRFIPTDVIHEWIRLTALLRRGLEGVPGYIRSEEGKEGKERERKEKGQKAQKAQKAQRTKAKSGLREVAENKDR